MTLIDTADGVVTVGAAASITVHVEQDDAPLDLSGKTVTATVRAANNDQAVIHADLEGMGDGVVTVPDADSGVVRVDLSAELTAHLDAPATVSQARGYYLQIVVVEDNYAPNPIKFSVRRAAAALGG